MVVSLAWPGQDVEFCGGELGEWLLKVWGCLAGALMPSDSSVPPLLPVSVRPSLRKRTAHTEGISPLNAGTFCRPAAYLSEKELPRNSLLLECL